jgi:anti-sigma factor ChrR (cupin superfamily)
MHVSKLTDYKKGWFIGAFSPTIINTEDVEVAVKIYRKGDSEAKHYHKIAREISVVISGIVSLNNDVFYPGDIIEVAPNEPVSFRALSDAKTVVVKYPGASNDKYPFIEKEK